MVFQIVNKKHSSSRPAREIIFRDQPLEKEDTNFKRASSELVLAGDESTVLDRTTVLSDDVVDGGEEPKAIRCYVSGDSKKVSLFVGAHVLEEKVQEGRNAGRVPPVPLEIGDDGKLGQDVNTSIPHTSIGAVSGAGIESTRSIGVGEDGVTSLKKG